MRSAKHGTRTSVVEVTNVSAHAVWLYLDGNEYFLPFAEFPWFRDATIRQIQNVKHVGGGHLYWPDLDVDLNTDILRNPGRYPLIADDPRAR